MFDFLKKKNAGTTVTLKINGMHCTSCALNINGALEDAEGVVSADTSYAKGKVVVSFDPAKISLPEISKIIENEGYQVGE